MYIQVISDNMHKLTNQQVRLLNDLEYSNIYANTLNKQQNLWNHHPVKNNTYICILCGFFRFTLIKHICSFKNV